MTEEIRLSDELGEGGGLYFILGNPDDKYACYQLVPAEQDKGILFLEVISRRGFMGLLGRKAYSKDFGLVSIEEAKQHIKQIFDHSVDSLYQQCKNIS